jgi:hypothetical protein
MEHRATLTTATKQPSDVPVMQPADSLPDLFSGILFDPSVSNQMSLMNFDEPDYNLAGALTEWENNIPAPRFT